MRFPKRGFTNAARVEYAVINVDTLEERFEAQSEVTLERLREMRIVKGRVARLKILGRGEITKPLTVKAHRFTKEARQKIEQAGGTTEEMS
jgi:large subunit ribosomal protein L15